MCCHITSPFSSSFTTSVLVSPNVTLGTIVAATATYPPSGAASIDLPDPAPSPVNASSQSRLPEASTLKINAATWDETIVELATTNSPSEEPFTVGPPNPAIIPSPPPPILHHPQSLRGIISNKPYV